jgi:hypothetical protein
LDLGDRKGDRRGMKMRDGTGEGIVRKRRGEPYWILPKLVDLPVNPQKLWCKAPPWFLVV